MGDAANGRSSRGRPLSRTARQGGEGREREERENTEPFWDGTKWTRRPKPGLNTVIPTTTKLG